MTLVIASQMDAAFNDRLRGHPVSPEVIGVPEEAPWEAAAEADVMLVRPFPAWRSHRQAPRPDTWPGRLRWVSSSSVGVDYYPGWLLDVPVVTCGRGIASDEIADYVIAAIYAHAKNLEAATVRGRGEWRRIPLGRVSGTTVGIIGLGAIGKEVAKRALAAGAHVTAVKRRRDGGVPPGVDLLDSVEDVVARAEHIVIAVPATSQTRHLINGALLARARPDAHLINIARGSIVDQNALVAALDADRLAFATLDVTDPEPLPEGHVLYTHPKVRLTPHISSNVSRIGYRQFEKVSANLNRFASGTPLSDVVDPAHGY